MEEKNEWTILQVFESEAEARVVESYLKANGFEPQLLGAHTYGYPVLHTRATGTGLRLAVRTEDAEAAIQVLREAEQNAAQEIPTATQIPTAPPVRQYERGIVILIFVLAALVYAAFKLR